MEPRGTLFLYRQDRLISRIRHLMYGWRFGRKVGINTVMLWLPTSKKYIPDDGHDFDVNSLFDVYALHSNPAFDDLSLVYGANPIRSDLPVVKDVLTLDPTRSAETARAELFRHGRHFISNDLVGYLFENEKRADVLSDLGGLFKSLPIHEKLSDRLHVLNKELGGQPYTIVHIRRGDVIRVLRNNIVRNLVGHDDMLQLLKRTAPLELYVRAATGSDFESGPLVVSSDDPDIAAQFKQKMGNRDCRSLSDIEFFGSKIQKDFFDFLVFVGAKKIIGTRASTYGKYASIFGKSTFVDVEFKPTPEQLATFFDEEVAFDLPVSREILERTKATLLDLNDKMNSGQFP